MVFDVFGKGGGEVRSKISSSTGWVEGISTGCCEVGLGSVSGMTRQSVSCVSELGVGQLEVGVELALELGVGLGLGLELGVGLGLGLGLALGERLGLGLALGEGLGLGGMLELGLGLLLGCD